MASSPATARGGRPISGPRAVGDDPRRALYLSLALAVTDFKLRFFGSVLGYFWQLVRPLLLFGVLYFVFTEFVRLGEGVPFYPVVLLSNIVLFTFFAEGSAPLTSLVDRESLVRKVQFPLIAIPLAAVLLAAFNLVLNGLAVLVFALASGVRPHWSWLEFPLLLGALAVFVARPGDAALGAVRALSRREADLGGRPPGLLLRDPDHLCDRDDPDLPEGAGADHAEPACRHHPAVPARDHRPRRPERGGRGRRGRRGC